MKTIVGDILTPNNTDRVVIICHQVNCKGVMGAGLALQIKNKFPMVYKHYKDKCLQIENGIGGLGDVQFCSVLSENGYIIANIFGQYDYGRGRCHTDYNALKKAFNTIALAFPNFTIRIPYKIGCGLGGGDWSVVSQIIQSTLVDAGVEVEIWRIN